MPRKKQPAKAPSLKNSKNKRVEEDDENNEDDDQFESSSKKAKLTESSGSLKKSSNLRGSKNSHSSPEETLFEAYQDESKENIDPFGMEKLLNDLQISAESFETLCLCYKFGAQKMGYFSKEEFLSGLKNMNAQSIPQIQKYLKGVNREFNDPNNFKSLYEFAFKFCKGENKDTRTIDLEAGREMLKCVLGGKYEITTKFAEYLQRCSYKSLNLDQWKMFYEFAKKVKPDLSDFSENDCWPVIIDDFVEWMRKRDTATTEG